MKNMVKIVDDTYKTTLGWFKGSAIQDPRKVTHVFEDRHLELAVLRARRYIRSPQRKWINGHVVLNAPKHIALMIAAFSEADPTGFKEAMGIAD